MNISCRQKVSASNPYQPPQPDPVLWFPGGDAECGVNAGREYPDNLDDENIELFSFQPTMIWAPSVS